MNQSESEIGSLNDGFCSRQTELFDIAPGVRSFYPDRYLSDKLAASFACYVEASKQASPQYHHYARALHSLLFCTAANDS
jgi:hypothetical protein